MRRYNKFARLFACLCPILTVALPGNPQAAFLNAFPRGETSRASVQSAASQPPAETRTRRKTKSPAKRPQRAEQTGQQESIRTRKYEPDFSALDSVLADAVLHDNIPGAVVLVGHGGRIEYEKAFGWRALLPEREPMTTGTIFDLASLTKVVATAPSLMKLVEEGRVRLNDPVSTYLPEFTGDGKDQITVRMLLTHTSGLAADAPLEAARAGREALFREINSEKLVAPPGAEFIYSDTGYIVLGELVERVSGMPLEQFAAMSIFQPLGMSHTGYLPPTEWTARIAPTEEVDLPEGGKAGSGQGHVLRGVAHDPRARAIGGVAGHAGLFSTAEDLAIFCQMMLDEGRLPGRAGGRVLAAATVVKMTTPQSAPWVAESRGLGWDIDSKYSSVRGEYFRVGSYGHSGFTGTSMWIDPSTQTYVILLANSVHPYQRTAMVSLRSRVSTVVAASLGGGSTGEITSANEREVRARRVAGAAFEQPHAKVMAGIDVLEEEQFAPLSGKRVGLITNQTGVDSQGRRTADVLAHAPGVQLVALFSPEHGLVGRMDSRVADGTDAATGLPVYSLYGATLRPTDAMLTGLDALVYDIQDAGVRFYTFTTTMAYAMEEAAKHHIAFYVLDRPDPVGGEVIEGPMLDAGRTSFTGYFPLPIRYGLTPGELARLFNDENHIGADLQVVEMKDWRRDEYYESTGLPWISPSPHLPTLDGLLLYPGVELLQAGGVSVGRGTGLPFLLVGAPWIRGGEFAEELNRRFMGGVRFVPTEFTPTEQPLRGQECEGVAIVITDRYSVAPVRTGLEIASALEKLYPNEFHLEKIETLLGSRNTLEKLEANEPPARILQDDTERQSIDNFRQQRAKYLLYP